MSQDEWINKDLSHELPMLREAGEGQTVEFKEAFPSNGYDLSKEIAAFASCNPGKIIIGVDDNGSLIGLDKVDSPKNRDDLCLQITGKCTNNIKPAITPVIKFAQEDGKSVLVIEVPRGEQPIYYSGGKPYIRHHSQSRPAEPNEVLERISKWLKISPLAPNGGESVEEATQRNFLTTLADTLVEILIFGTQLKDREVNPWLEDLRFQLGVSGRLLRDLATEDVAQEMKVDKQLEKIADNLDKAENHRLALGADSFAEMEKYIVNAVQISSEVKAELIDKTPLSEDSKINLKTEIRKNARKLTNLVQRAEQLIEGGSIEQVQDEGSQIGYALLRVCHNLRDDWPVKFVEELRTLALELHLLETMRIYMDGRQSMDRILEKLQTIGSRLQDLVAEQNIGNN